ncbi:MAG: T9SS type A sorting domain-containing protein [Ignavibacteriaceae bacterium]|nr:T9SS type A sorting domain-containing protein [Ignavibacteriaceae bacterium]
MLWLIFAGWGNVGHRIINPNAVNSFPQAFKQFSFWKDSLANHASDADTRKSKDKNESPKHYIDLEEFSDFITKGSVIQNYDSAVAKYGLYAITNAGSLPWTIKKCYDTLVSAFQQKDWHHAVLLSADLGHYIGDANMPLHLTTNYDGRPSSQTSNGIHSRYESTMISKYSTSLPIQQNEAVYLANAQDYIFTMVYQNYHYVDSLYLADSISYTTAKSNNSDLYYSTLWSLTKNYTGKLFSNASETIASVMYTAWVNAGSPAVSPTLAEELNLPEKSFSLAQNYPNPFNPTTVISYKLAVGSYVTLKVYDVLGNEIVTLVDEVKEAGSYEVEFQSTVGNRQLAGGVYFYRLKAGAFVQTKKMLYLK